MLNDEIGTYPIVAALDENPDLPLYRVDDRKVQMDLNGKVYTGNIDVIESMFPNVSFCDELYPVEVIRRRDAVLVLSEDFGIEFDEDWLDCIEDPLEIWNEAKILSNEVMESEEVSIDDNAFSFDGEEDEQMYYKHYKDKND